MFVRCLHHLSSPLLPQFTPHFTYQIPTPPLLSSNLQSQLGFTLSKSSPYVLFLGTFITMPRQALYLHGETVSNAMWSRTLSMITHKGCMHFFFQHPQHHYLYSIHRYVWRVYRQDFSRRLFLLNQYPSSNRNATSQRFLFLTRNPNFQLQG